MSRRDALDWFVPRTARRALVRRARRLVARPRIGHVDFGALRRLTPVCADWGYSRGTAIDRHYIHRFLTEHAGDVRGHVLEVGTNELTQQYGTDRVTRCDVLHVADSRPPVTIVADLRDAPVVPSESFDCILITQTLHFIYDVRSVVATLHRILKPGGVVLATVPGITKISPEDMARWGQFWSFTTLSARQVFEESFAPERVTITAAGNVLAATAFLQGIAAEELTQAELDHVDPYFETLVGVRAQKAPDR